MINSTTGEIKTNATLDRETSSQFILTVRAQDSEYILVLCITMSVNDPEI